MSIKKLHVAGLPTRVQFHAITVDSGGGGAVQNIHPKLIANNIMLATSKKINCQCHGLNKCFKTLSMNTFGKQGIGQVFFSIGVCVCVTDEDEGGWADKNYLYAPC